MEKYAEIIKLIEKIFGKGAVARSLGTRTNVVRFPKGAQPLDPTTKHFDVAGTAQKNPELVNTIKNSIEDRIGDLGQMNDQQLLNYKGNLQRLDNHLNPPSADVLEAGDIIEARNKQRGIENLLKDFGVGQVSIQRMYDEGLVRSTARQILLNDIKAGKIKNISESEIINMKEPLDPFRRIYGEGALEQLDSLIPNFRNLKTETQAEELARSKFKFEPDENRLPGSVSIEEGREAEKKFGINKPKEPEVINIKSEADKRKSIDDLIDEYNANQDRLLLTDEEGGTLIGYQEFNKIKNRNEEIAKALEEKGISSTPETKPEAKIIPLKEGIIKPKQETNVEYNLQQGKDIDLNAALKDYKFLKPRKSYPFGKDYKEDTRLIAEDMANHVYKKEFSELPEDIQSKLHNAANEEYMNILSTDGYARGGSVGLDYLMGFDNRPKYASGGDVKKLLDLISQFNKQLKGKKAMQVINPKTGEVTSLTNPIKLAEEPRTLGGLPIAEESANIGDKLDELSKAGLDTFEKQKQYLDLRSKFIDSLDPRRQNKALDSQRKSIDTEQRLLLKAEEKGLDFDTFEKLRTGLYGGRKQKSLDFIKTGKVDVEPVKAPTTFEEVQSRYKTAAKAHEEIQPNFNDPRTAASSLADVMAEQKYGKSYDELSGDKQSDLYGEAYDYIVRVNALPKVSPKLVPLQTLENKMNEVLNQYDKSMFIKNDQGMVDVTHPENIEKMRFLLERDHPELYEQIYKHGDDLTQKQQLLDFDVTGRKPNKDGGLNYLLGF